MDLSRYLELYIAESRDHLRFLNNGLLALEKGQDVRGGVEEAFRAAHTIKGMSATMGFRVVAELCHALEDRLDDVRRERLHASREVVDDLLARADALEHVIDRAAAGDLAAANGEAADDAALRGVPSSVGDAPASGPGRIARVQIDPGAPMKAARAMLLVRSLQRQSLITKAEPAEFGDDFDGVLVIDIAEAAATDEVRAAILGSPEIASVAFEAAGAAARESKVEARPAARLVRVDQARLDSVASGVAELAVLYQRLAHEAGDETTPLAQMIRRVGVLANELQEAVLAMRMVPVSDVFDRFPRFVRDTAHSLGKEVDFRIEGGDVEVDRSLLEEIVDPMMHLLRNAIDHGLEGPVGRIEAEKPPKGSLVLRAIRERSSVRIELEDDGRGVNAARVVEKAHTLHIPVPHEVNDEDLLRILTHPGFSTADQVTAVSGRGVGMDAVATRIRALGGALHMRTEFGRGTTFVLRLPITLAIAQALHVRVAGEDYAIPLTHVSEAVLLDEGAPRRRRGQEVVRVRDETIPLVRLREVLQAPRPGREAAAVIAETGERRSALAVDELVGREQILIKEFDSAIGALKIFSGVTILADGRPALVLDPLSVV